MNAADHASRLEWAIGLSAWIIQDGNYGDFQVGQNVEFALEFYSETFHPNKSKAKTVRHLGGSQYAVCGEIIYMTDDVWVLDFGVSAYREDRPPKGLNLHDFVSAEIYLGIDPFMYFERLNESPEMPPLIYSWKIDSILKLTSATDFQPVNQTDAWNDDNGPAEYILNCIQLPTAPKSRFTKILKN